MKRRRLIAIVAVLLLGWLAFLLILPSEPSYQGRKLSKWLADFQAADMSDTTTNSEQLFRTTEHAVQEMGSNAIPVLLQWLQAEDSPTKLKLNRFLDRQGVISFRFLTAREKQTLAVSGFVFLGNDAKSAVPALVQVLQAPDHHQRFLAMECIFKIDVYQHDLLPAILPMLQNSDPKVQHGAAYYLHSRYPEAAEKAGVYEMHPDIKRRSTNEAGTITPPPNK